MAGGYKEIEGFEIGHAETGQHEYLDFDTLIRLAKIPSTVIEVTSGGNYKQWKIKNAPIFKPLSERILRWATSKVKQEYGIKASVEMSMQVKAQIHVVNRSMPIAPLMRETTSDDWEGESNASFMTIGVECSYDKKKKTQMKTFQGVRGRTSLGIPLVRKAKSNEMRIGGVQDRMLALLQGQSRLQRELKE